MSDASTTPATLQSGRPDIFKKTPLSFIGGSRQHMTAGCILPDFEEFIKKPRVVRVEVLRLLAETVAEWTGVHLAAMNAVAAHRHTFTGGRNGIARMHSLYTNADAGAGHTVLLQRAFADYVLAGAAVFGNEWRDGRIVDVYHVDAAHVSRNFGTDEAHPADVWPLRYGSDYYFQRNGYLTQVWTVEMAPYSAIQSRRNTGALGAIPAEPLYALARTVLMNMAITQAVRTGEAITQVALFAGDPQQITGGIAMARASDDDKAHDINEVFSGRSTTVFVHVNELDSKTIDIRKVPTPEEMKLDSEKLQLIAAQVYGVDPMLINPRLSGAGGLNEGTKAKASDDAAGGRAIARFMHAVESGENAYVNPASVQTAYEFDDPRDGVRDRAAFSQVVAPVRELMDAGVLRDATEARRMLRAVLPQRFANALGPDDMREVADDENSDLQLDNAQDDTTPGPVAKARARRLTVKKDGAWLNRVGGEFLEAALGKDFDYSVDDVPEADDEGGDDAK